MKERYEEKGKGDTEINFKGEKQCRKKLLTKRTQENQIVKSNKAHR